MRRLEAAGGGKLTQPTRPPPWLPQELGCFGAWVEARLSLKWEVIIRQGLGSSSVIDRESTGSSRTSEAGGRGGPSVFCGWARLPRHPLPCPQPGPRCLEVRGCEPRVGYQELRQARPGPVWTEARSLARGQCRQQLCITSHASPLQ